MSVTAAASPARSRVLATATALFYAEGIHTVGIDRIIAEAGVAKATFYHHFPAKEALVRAYVEQQSQHGRAALGRLGGLEPRAALLAVFDGIADAAEQPGWRGCPFINAAAEYPDPDSPVRRAVEDHRRWKRGLLVDLLTSDGCADPGPTADILTALGDGFLVASHLDKPPNLRELIHTAMTAVLDRAGQ